MRSFFYEGADYKGKPTWVFAYYAAPEGKPPEGGWPAVVCAHGGGGTAFPAWVTQWNRTMLWVSGFNEPVFPLNLFSKSAETAGGTSTLCIRPFLPHGHGFGWEEVWEIGGFANGGVWGDASVNSVLVEVKP